MFFFSLVLNFIRKQMGSAVQVRLTFTVHCFLVYTVWQKLLTDRFSWKIFAIFVLWASKYFTTLAFCSTRQHFYDFFRSLKKVRNDRTFAQIYLFILFCRGLFSQFTNIDNSFLAVLAGLSCWTGTLNNEWAQWKQILPPSGPKILLRNDSIA